MVFSVWNGALSEANCARNIPGPWIVFILRSPTPRTPYSIHSPVAWDLHEGSVQRGNGRAAQQRQSTHKISPQNVQRRAYSGLSCRGHGVAVRAPDKDRACAKTQRFGN